MFDVTFNNPTHGKVRLKRPNGCRIVESALSHSQLPYCSEDVIILSLPSC